MCIRDRLRLDQRVPLSWDIPEEKPLTRRELVERIPLQQRFGPAVLGVVLLSFFSAGALLVPLPEQRSIDVPDTEARIETPES